MQIPGSLLDGEEHLIDIVERDTGLYLTEEPIRWRSASGTTLVALTGNKANVRVNRPGATPDMAALAGTRILFDVSDLIYYIGHHPNLTGIQRVQSSIVLSIIKGDLVRNSSVMFLSYDAVAGRWMALPTEFLARLLQDLFLPELQRQVTFSLEEARIGRLPGAQMLDGLGLFNQRAPSVLCLLGAAWVQRDYFHRVLVFKRRFGTKFVMMMHDLIPIYVRDTCDQGTVRVFEDFLRRALGHVDHYLSVSNNTARDLRHYIRSLSLPEPAITVTRNGSSFDEFSPGSVHLDDPRSTDMPDRFVLFVSTVEGRKNHQLMMDVWRQMVTRGDDPPVLICVGRVGWKSREFLADLVETGYLNGKVILLQDISDAYLRQLYSRCLFTVFPSLYEGWGLPVGESLAAGKICVCSDRTSVPEVAGELGVYLDIDSLERSYEVIRRLIHDDVERGRLEAKIRSEYKPITWRSVAQVIVNACEAAVKEEWQDPYPYTLVPYAAEVSFAWLDRSEDGTFGDNLLNRMVGARKGHFLYDPLQEQSFLRGECVRAGGAWAQPENWGTWLCHLAGDLVMALEPDDSLFYFVFLRLRASEPAGTLPVRLSANGEIAWQGSIGHDSTNIVLRVRKKFSGVGAYWRLTIRAEADLSPEVFRQIAAIDNRVPTIGFERLVVVQEDDLKTRLNVLTNCLL
jgi:glycosyltransferase involved in cell wall biosynthesis